MVSAGRAQAKRNRAKGAAGKLMFCYQGTTLQAAENWVAEWKMSSPVGTAEALMLCIRARL
jgi:hypothetical protein